MIKMFSTIAMAGLMAAALSGASQAQEKTLRKITTSGPPASVQGAMTQAQANKACRAEMRGTRESKKSLRIKMRQCVNQKMTGN